MKRVIFFAVLALSLFGLFGVVAQAASNPPGTTDPVTDYTKTADVRVKMPDGVSLDTDEYVPTRGCPCPVIVIQTPYRKSGSAVGMFNPYFPSHGYAEIVVDVRGTGSSEGYWTSFGPPEQRDGAVIVQYAARRPFSNGRIGLAGVSYAAINQFLTVEQPGTEAVKAIFPIVPMSDPYRDVVFSGGNTDTGFIPLWLGLVNGLNAIPADDWEKNPTIALNAESQHMVDIGQFAGQAVADSSLGRLEHRLPAQAQAFPDQAYDGPYYQTVAPISHVERVHVPTFIVGGEYDIFQRGEPILYRGLNLPTSQKKLVYGPWYHGSPSANLTADDGSKPVHDRQGNLVPSTNNLSLAWFDHWLKGVNNGIENFPTVETYQLGRGAWSSDSTFPASGTRYQPWFFGSAPASGARALYDGSLSTRAAAAGSTTIPWQSLTGECSRSTAQWTAGIADVSNCSSDNSLAEAAGASFTSAPFKADYTVSGPILADLWVSSTQKDTSVVATVTDVHPDGTSDRVTAGSLVASLRAWNGTPCGPLKVVACSLYSDGVPVIPWHPFTRASQAFLPAGAPTELKVEVFPTSLVLQAGHRLRVSITTGDAPHQGPNASTLANSTAGVDTLYFGGKTPSAVYLGAVGDTSRAIPRTASTGGTPTNAASVQAASPGIDGATATAGSGGVAGFHTLPAAARVPLQPLVTGIGAGLLVIVLAAGAWRAGVRVRS
jgi:putative CocE/NonD family hydrolase